MKIRRLLLAQVTQAIQPGCELACPVAHEWRGNMKPTTKYRFDPVDHRFMRLRGRLSPGERLQAMLAAREWVVGAMRDRLTRRYPHLSPEEINLKILDEIDRAERRQARP